MAIFVQIKPADRRSKPLLAQTIERIGDLAVIGCEGTIKTETACKLRDAVTSLKNMQIIVLDLSEVTLIEDTGVSTFLFLQQWAFQHRIQLKVFNPRWWVRQKLEHASLVPGFDFATLHEIVLILANAERHLPLAA
jgi:anti-anti-sigma regulatory factor